MHGCTTEQESPSDLFQSDFYRPQMKGQSWRGPRSPVWKKIDEGLAKLPILEEGRTVNDIAKALGVQRIFIARIERSALNKMQRALRQFALDIGLRAEIATYNPHDLPKIKGRGMYHKGDYV